LYGAEEELQADTLLGTALELELAEKEDQKVMVQVVTLSGEVCFEETFCDNWTIADLSDSFTRKALVVEPLETISFTLGGHTVKNTDQFCALLDEVDPLGDSGFQTTLVLGFSKIPLPDLPGSGITPVRRQAPLLDPPCPGVDAVVAPHGCIDPVLAPPLRLTRDMTLQEAFSAANLGGGRECKEAARIVGLNGFADLPSLAAQFWDPSPMMVFNRPLLLMTTFGLGKNGKKREAEDVFVQKYARFRAACFELFPR